MAAASHIQWKSCKQYPEAHRSADAHYWEKYDSHVRATGLQGKETPVSAFEDTHRTFERKYYSDLPPPMRIMASMGEEPARRMNEALLRYTA